MEDISPDRSRERWKQLRPWLVSLGALTVIFFLFYFLGEFILPFIIGLCGAYFVEPHIRKVQRFIPNRDLAVTAYLGVAILLIVALLVLFGAQMVKDVQRLNHAFSTYVQDHEEEIDEVNDEIRSYIRMIYDDESVQETLNSVSTDSSMTEDLGKAFSGITSFFSSGDSEDKPEEKGRSVNIWLLLFSAIGYFVYILYSFPYFEKRFVKYFGPPQETQAFIGQFLDDFRRIFLDYFRRRTWIVLICTAIFVTTYLILNVPGAIVLGMISGLLCYLAHFHYLTLLPLSLSCWVLSIEQGYSFFIPFGVIVGVMVLVSVLEELVLYPQIMEENSGINTAILVLFISIWTYLFGSVIGTFLALPLTTVVLIYADRLLLYWKKNRELQRAQMDVEQTE